MIEAGDVEPMQVYAARRVLRSEQAGSSWPVLVETDAGVFYTKLRGAAQAPASLVAEIVVGGLADALELPVPARVLIEIRSDTCIDEPHQELCQLVRASAGFNLGFQRLPDGRSFRAIDAALVNEDLASRILWLDGLVQNPDRTITNPNLLWSQGQLWLIDHGACLGFQHAWGRVTEQSPRTNGWLAASHVLHGRATRLTAVDEPLAGCLSRDVLESAVDDVPDDLLAENGGEASRRRRAAYVAYLWKRLKPPRPFVS
jgi:hypothetical protein